MFSEYDQLFVPDALIHAAESTRTSTLATATLSDADPATLIVPDTFAPADGVVIVTLGATLSREALCAVALEAGASASKRQSPTAQLATNRLTIFFSRTARMTVVSVSTFSWTSPRPREAPFRAAPGPAGPPHQRLQSIHLDHRRHLFLGGEPAAQSLLRSTTSSELWKAPRGRVNAFDRDGIRTTETLTGLPLRTLHRIARAAEGVSLDLADRFVTDRLGAGAWLDSPALRQGYFSAERCLRQQLTPEPRSTARAGS